MKTLLIIALILTSCGGSDGGSSTDEAPSTEISAQEAENPARKLSITLAKVADLPDCSDELEAQLAYVKENKQFYSCEGTEWVKIDIEGRDGVDGSDGVTTVIEQEATNKENQWVDPVSGLAWLIGGTGNLATATAGCASPYRLPSESEALASISRGLMVITAGISAGQTFWINQAPSHIIMLTAGVPAKYAVSGAATHAVYCVK